MITTVIADVAGAYFNLLELDLELEIARRTLASREDSLQLIRTREAGWHRDASRGSGRRTTGVRGSASDPRNRAADRANGERDQTAAWRAPGGNYAGAIVVGAGGATVGPSWIALVAARTAPRHPGCGAESRRRQRHHRRGQGGLLSPDQPDRLPGLSKHRAVESLHWSDERVAVRSPGDATDFQRRSNQIECQARRGPTTDRAGPVRTSDPERLPGGVGRTHSISTDERDSRATGAAGRPHSRTGRVWLTCDTVAESACS